MNLFRFQRNKKIIKKYLPFLLCLFPFAVIAQQVHIVHDSKIVDHRNYDYAPALMIENDKFKMYWCGEDRGDQIFYSESSSITGPWSTPRTVFRSKNTSPGAKRSQKHFDGLHACDPSIVKARGKYYLYYGGLPSEPRAQHKCKTKIGVAESLDGQTWSRLNSGLPIVGPERKCNKNPYGVGQPSVVFLEGYFYMIYTDTAGYSSNQKNGAGLYVIRSRSPLFINREVRTPRQWVAVNSGVRVTDFKLVDGFSADMMYSDALDNFVVAMHTDHKHTTIRFFDRNFSKARPDMKVLGSWKDGPGLLRRPNGHALPSVGCNILPATMIRARGGASPASWDLHLTDAYLELDSVNCTADQLQRTYSGFLVRSSNMPLALITDKGRVQLESTANALLQAINPSLIYVSNEIYLKFAYLGDIGPFQKAISSENLPSAIVTSKNYRIQFSCNGPIRLNNSSILNISSREFHQYPLGGEIFCSR